MNHKVRVYKTCLLKFCLKKDVNESYQLSYQSIFPPLNQVVRSHWNRHWFRVLSFFPNVIEIHMNFSSVSRQPILIATVPQTYWRLFIKDKKDFRSFLWVKAFDWKNSYWAFWCAISVSILSCYFDYGRRCDKISPFWIFSNISLLEMSWFIYSNPSFLQETQQERKAISTIHPLSNMNNQWGFLIH